MNRNAIALTAGILLAGGPAWAAQITLSVDNAAPEVGETVAVTIHASVAAGESFVSANQFLTFDNTMLELVEQSAGTAGDFVADSQGLPAINAFGEVRAGVCDTNPISGTLTLGVFRFRTLAAGTTQVTTRGYDAQTAPFGDLLARLDYTEVEPGASGPLTIVIGGSGGGEALRMTGAVMTSGGFEILWMGREGKSYTVQASSNLLAGFTVNLLTGIPGAAPVMNVYTVTTWTADCGFFRVQEE